MTKLEEMAREFFLDGWDGLSSKYPQLMPELLALLSQVRDAERNRASKIVEEVSMNPPMQECTSDKILRRLREDA